MTTVEARQQRSALVDQMKLLVARADGRALTTEESAQWDKLDLQQGRLAQTIATLDPDHAPRRSYIGDRDGLAQVEQELSESLGTVAARRQEDHPSHGPVREERVLGHGEMVRSYVLRETKTDPEISRLGIGKYLRAMVLGARTAIERRALNEGVDASGGYTVPDVLSAELIDRMRSQLVCVSLGARTVALTSDNLSVARLATDPVAAFRLENAPVVESEPTFERVQFIPRSLAVYFKASIEALQDSVNLESSIPDMLAKAMAVQVDAVALSGSGTAPEPRGIRYTAGVNEISGAGALTSYAKLIDLAAAVWAKNAKVTGFVMSPREYAKLGGLADTTGQPLQVPPILANIPLRQTSSVSITEAPGTAAAIYCGDWSQLWFGVRTSVQLQVLKERYMPDAMQVGFLCWTRVDVQLAHPGAFGRLIGVTPTVAREQEEDSPKGKRAA